MEIIGFIAVLILGLALFILGVVALVGIVFMECFELNGEFLYVTSLILLGLVLIYTAIINSPIAIIVRVI